MIIEREKTPGRLPGRGGILVGAKDEIKFKKDQEGEDAGQSVQGNEVTQRTSNDPG